MPRFFQQRIKLAATGQLQPASSGNPFSVTEFRTMRSQYGEIRTMLTESNEFRLMVHGKTYKINYMITGSWIGKTSIYFAGVCKFLRFQGYSLRKMLFY
jgi:hypothetical protein